MAFYFVHKILVFTIHLGVAALGLFEEAQAKGVDTEAG
jgi:hypothetical protein